MLLPGVDEVAAGVQIVELTGCRSRGQCEHLTSDIDDLPQGQDRQGGHFRHPCRLVDPKITHFACQKMDKIPM